MLANHKPYKYGIKCQQQNKQIKEKGIFYKFKWWSPLRFFKKKCLKNNI